MKQHSPGFLKLVEDAKSRVREISVADVRAHLERRQPFRFIDVREDREWAQGHAAGAEHMGRGVLERDVEKAIPDFQTLLVLYCGGGFRSALAADSRSLSAMSVSPDSCTRAKPARAWRTAATRPEAASAVISPALRAASVAHSNFRHGAGRAG